jgi:hypothetical protein
MRGVIRGFGPNTTYWIDEGGIVGLVQVSREVFDAAFPSRPLDEPPGGHSPGAWPMLSDALAVHPSQIAEVMERNHRHGLYIEYNAEDGRPILMDRGQRRDLLKVEHLKDNEGGYGDG